MTSLAYRLFGVPKFPEEFIKKSALEGRSILISYQTKHEVHSTSGNLPPPFLSFKIFVVLDSVPNPKKEKKVRQFKMKVDSGNKSQFSEDNPLFYEVADALEKVVPEIVGLCDKYHVKYSLAGKVSEVLLSDRTHPEMS
jgi:hypothetical protein